VIPVEVGALRQRFLRQPSREAITLDCLTEGRGDGIAPPADGLAQCAAYMGLSGCCA
jgi:hypothetical protein